MTDKTLNERIAELEAKGLRRELPPEPMVAASREYLAKAKDAAAGFTASGDKGKNRAAAWNAVRSATGWSKTPGGARYVGSRGVAVLTGKSGVFTVGGTSSKSREFGSLQAAIEAAENIGGFPKVRTAALPVVEEEKSSYVPEASFGKPLAQDLHDRALEAVHQRVAPQTAEDIQKCQGIAEEIAKRAEQLVGQKNHDRASAVAQAVDEMAPPAAGGPVAPAAPGAGATGIPTLDSSKLPFAKADPEAESDADTAAEASAIDALATQVADLVESGVDPKDAVYQAVEAIAGQAELEPPGGPEAEPKPGKPQEAPAAKPADKPAAEAKPAKAPAPAQPAPDSYEAKAAEWLKGRVEALVGEGKTEEEATAQAEQELEDAAKKVKSAAV